MQPTIEVAVISAAVALLIGFLSTLTSLWIQRRQMLTEDNAAKTVRLLLKDERFGFRPFEIIKRRIGGYEEDELRRVLVRAGAVRFYRPYRLVYFGEDTSWMTAEQNAFVDNHEPIEVWGLANRAPALGYLLGQSLADAEGIDSLPGFPTQVR